MPGVAEVNYREIKCPVCGQAEREKVFDGFDRYDHSFVEKYPIWRCLGCGTLYLNPLPVPRNWDYFYPADIINPFLEFEANHQDFFQKLYAFVHPYALAWKRKQVEKFAGVGRILDVECGNGDFLFSMRRHLWEVVGTERIGRYAKFARQTLGIKVFDEVSELVSSYANYFDAVTFWHSFSRFDEPAGILAAVRTVLRDEGFLFVGIPNVRSVDFYFYGKDWAALDIPRRLFHISPVQMRQFARAHGWKIVAEKPIGLDYYYNALLSEKIRLRRLKKAKPLAVLGYARGGLLATLSRILGITKNGSGMLYVLQKRLR